MVQASATISLSLSALVRYRNDSDYGTGRVLYQCSHSQMSHNSTFPQFEFHVAFLGNINGATWKIAVSSDSDSDWKVPHRTFTRHHTHPHGMVDSLGSWRRCSTGRCSGLCISSTTKQSVRRMQPILSMAYLLQPTRPATTIHMKSIL
jgi:hypothetical protein